MRFTVLYYKAQDENIHEYQTELHHELHNEPSYTLFVTLIGSNGIKLIEKLVH